MFPSPKFNIKGIGPKNTITPPLLKPVNKNAINIIKIPIKINIKPKNMKLNILKLGTFAIGCICSSHLKQSHE